MSTPYPFDCLPVHPPPEPLESFTGYMLRLAELNRIRSITALRSVLFSDPDFRPHLQVSGTDVVWRPFDRFAAAAGCSLEQLRATTTFHLATKFGCRSAHAFLRSSLAAHVRYCPACLRAGGYYRLDWRFLTLPGCAQHGKRLLDRCGSCGQAMALFNPCLRLGICPHCQADLRLDVAPVLTEAEQYLTQLRTPDLAYLLAPQGWEGEAPVIRARAGAYLRCQRQEQHVSSVRLAQQLGVPQPSLRSIESVQARREGVSFQLRLAYSDALKTTWSATFQHVVQHPDWPTDGVQLRAQRLLEQVEAAIVSLEQSGQPLSKIAISRAVNLSPECFRLYPGVKQLMETLPERVRQQREQRWLKAAQTAVTTLQEAGQAITLPALHRQVPRFPRQLAPYPQLWAFLAQYIDPAQLAPKPAPTAHPREVLLVQQLATLTAQLSAQDLPVTLSILATALGLSLAAVYAYPTLHRHLTQARQRCTRIQQQRTETRLVRQARRLIAEQTRQGQRCSIQSVCLALGKPYIMLAKYPRLYALLQHVKTPRGKPKTVR